MFAGWNEAVATQFSADKTYTAQYTLKKSQISYLFESQDVTPYLSDLDQYKPADYQADYFTTQTPASPSALSHAVSNGKWFWK